MFLLASTDFGAIHVTSLIAIIIIRPLYCVVYMDFLLLLLLSSYSIVFKDLSAVKVCL